MRSMRVVALLLVAMIGRADATPAPWRWLRPLPVGEEPAALTADARGHVLVATRSETRGTVTKLHGRTGRVLWRRRPPLRPHAVAVGLYGDAILGGAISRDDGSARSDAGVARLRSRSGGVRWRWAIDGAGDDAIVRVAVGADLAVYAAGHRQQQSVREGVVVRLDFTTGEETWRAQRLGDCASDGAIDLALTADGAPVVLSRTCGDGHVARLDAALGTTRWSRAVDDSPALAISALGDVVVLARDERAYAVALEAATGSQRWRWDAEPGLAPSHVVALPGGDLIAQLVSVVLEPQRPPRLIAELVRLDGATGAERWRRGEGEIDAALPRLFVLSAADAFFWASGSTPPGETRSIVRVDVDHPAIGFRADLTPVHDVRFAAPLADSLALAGWRDEPAAPGARGYVGRLR